MRGTLTEDGTERRSPMKWIIRQEWRDVLFVHFRVDPGLIQSLIPFDLDLFEGAAVLSIVPFEMRSVRFPLTPVVPGVSNLRELNLRTYVKVGSETGVYFVTLDTDHALAVWIARFFFHLPYRKVRMHGKVTGDRYRFESLHPEHGVALEAALQKTARSESKLHTWAVERYQLFTKDRERVYRGRVRHEPWSTSPVDLIRIEEGLSSMIGLQLPSEGLEAHYQEVLQVEFSPFEELPVQAISTFRR